MLKYLFHGLMINLSLTRIVCEMTSFISWNPEISMEISLEHVFSQPKSAGGHSPIKYVSSLLPGLIILSVIFYLEMTAQVNGIMVLVIFM